VTPGHVQTGPAGPDEPAMLSVAVLTLGKRVAVWLEMLVPRKIGRPPTCAVEKYRIVRKV
jgi:hypothetical protein